MFCQDFPASVDLKTPNPGRPDRANRTSPVPTHTVSGSDFETATAPIAPDDCCSKTGSHVNELLTVFQIPPDPTPRYIVLGSPSGTANDSIRPPCIRGPMASHSSSRNGESSRICECRFHESSRTSSEVGVSVATVKRAHDKRVGNKMQFVTMTRSNVGERRFFFFLNIKINNNKSWSFASRENVIIWHRKYT